MQFPCQRFHFWSVSFRVLQLNRHDAMLTSHLNHCCCNSLSLCKYQIPAKISKLFCMRSKWVHRVLKRPHNRTIETDRTTKTQFTQRNISQSGSSLPLFSSLSQRLVATPKRDIHALTREEIFHFCTCRCVHKTNHSTV